MALKRGTISLHRSILMTGTMESMDTTTDIMDQWLHTHILRRPAQCDGVLRSLYKGSSICPPLTNVPYPALIQDWEIFSCDTCGYEGVHQTLNQGYREIHGGLHRAPIPPYCTDATEMLKLLRSLRGRDQSSGLLHRWLLLSGFSGEDLPLSKEDLDIAISWEVAKAHLRRTAEILEQAWESARIMEEMPLLQNAYGPVALARINHLNDLQGRPLFARIGPRRDFYHSLETPYLVVGPDLFLSRSGHAVLIEETHQSFIYSILESRVSPIWKMGKPFSDGRGQAYLSIPVTFWP